MSRIVSILVLALPLRAAADEAPVTVYAASSLADVLPEIGRRFAAQTGLPPPTFAFAGSSTLVHQIEYGAPADLVVTADTTWMDYLIAHDDVVASTRVTLGHNRLVAVVPAGSAAPGGPHDLVAPEVATIGVAAAPVPAGRRAREAIASTGVTEAVTEKFVVARSVRAALALVARGKVDVALVYRTDAEATDAVDEAFVFPEDAHAPIEYAAALTPRGAEAPRARAFAAFITSDPATAVLLAAGFAPGPGRATQASPTAAALVSDPPLAAPLRLSLWVAAMSLALSVLPAVALGWLLARRQFVGKSILSTVLLTPLVLPPVVVGFGLLETFGRGGPLAGIVTALGIPVAFTQFGAVVAASVVGFPLLVLMSRLAIEAVDVRYEQLAQTLGLTPFQAFVRVTLPMALPGLAAGCVLAFARALGEFG
ncbi:MAG: molybdate ABC transporter substrate-binding protein, partial [Myxococcota bacterium]